MDIANKTKPSASDFVKMVKDFFPLVPGLPQFFLG